MTNLNIDFEKYKKIRCEIHSKPELKYQEHLTAEKIVQVLSDIGYTDVKTGIGKTGVVALCDSGKPGKTVALRADIDALPIQEENKFSHCSTHKGVMHGCGHDGHTASLLAAAEILWNNKTHFNGRVKLLFQPAEEGGLGAQAMIKDGALKNPDVDVIFGCHNIPGLIESKVYVRANAILCGLGSFNIDVKGRAAHGSMPDKNVNAALVASQIISSLQSIPSRAISPLELVSIVVTSINCGEIGYILPEKAKITGFIKAVSVNGLNKLQENIKLVAEKVAEIYKGSAEVGFGNMHIPTINHLAEYKHVMKSAETLFGEDGYCVLDMPLLPAEDFSYYMEEVPGCYFIIGSGKDWPQLHTSHYDYNNEILPTAAKMLAKIALDYLK